MPIKRISKGLQTCAYMEFCHVKFSKIILFFVLFLGIIFESKAQTADELFYQACTYTIEGKYSKAISFYDKTIKTDSQYWYAYLNRASVYTLKGNYKKAIADLDIFLRYDTESPGALESRGILLTETGNYLLAQTDLLRAVQLNPDSNSLNYYLGIVYFNIKEYDLSIASFRLYLNENPEDWQSLYYISTANFNNYNFDEACAYAISAKNSLNAQESAIVKTARKEQKTLENIIKSCNH